MDYFASLIFFGEVADETLVSKLSQKYKLKICFIDEINEGDKISVSEKNLSAPITILSGGQEPVLSYLRFWRESIVKSFLVLTKLPNRNFLNQLSIIVDFMLTDLNFEQLENFIDNPKTADLKWLKTKDFWSVVEFEFGSQKPFENASFFLDPDRAEQVFCLAWFLKKHLKTFSIETVEGGLGFRSANFFVKLVPGPSFGIRASEKSIFLKDSGFVTSAGALFPASSFNMSLSDLVTWGLTDFKVFSGYKATLPSILYLSKYLLIKG